MPFITTIGTTSLFGFGLSLAVDRSAAYFYNASNPLDPLWSNPASWYTEALHTNSSAFPTDKQTAYVLTDTEVVLDNSVVGGVYTNWSDLNYWAPPTGITGVGEGASRPDITIVSNAFSDAPEPIEVFAPGNGTYALGTIVEYPGSSDTYYEAIAQADDTDLVDGIPDPAFWADQPSLPSDYPITNFKDVVFEGVVS
jgi:hypothetical protein